MSSLSQPGNFHAFNQQQKTPPSSKGFSSSKSSSGASSKDSSKTDEKEVKIKQEGQKPTMETQGKNNGVF
jgi:hypothetical protein